MLNMTEEVHEHTTHLVNGTITSMENVLPLALDVHATMPSNHLIKLGFGVLIGITGEVKGKMLLIGEPEVFGRIGEAMFGMALEGDMLLSFSGELGNMVAGGMATSMTEQKIKTDITAPILLHGDTVMSGFKNGILIPVTVENAGEMNVYILFDQLTNEER